MKKTELETDQETKKPARHKMKRDLRKKIPGKSFQKDVTTENKRMRSSQSSPSSQITNKER
jgi:hypothetical protein